MHDDTSMAQGASGLAEGPDGVIVHEKEDQRSENHLQKQNTLSRIVSGIDEKDASSRYRIETKDNKISTVNSSAESGTDTPPEKKTIHWDENDPENPYNWSSGRKAGIVLIGIIIVINSTMGSSLPSNAIAVIASHFDIVSKASEVLLMSMYLIGYILGPLLFGPLSETYGRKAIMVATFFLFTVFTMACALAQNWASLLVFRFIAGINASSPISLVGGIYADIYDDPIARGRSIALFMGGTSVGPLVAPVLSGFVSTSIGWRWVFWVGLIFAGASWIPLYFLPETFGPILLVHRAQKLRKLPSNPQLFAPMELEKKGFKQMATVTLTRPLRMLCFELIVSASCAYLAVAYGIFYMFFEAYPIVFEGIYGQSPGISGLMFLPIGAGCMLALIFFLWWDTFHRAQTALDKPWTRKEESRRLPLACLGGPLYVISLFWLGWTSRINVPFYVPMLAGVPFGMGFILIFMALLNYLTDAYEIFAASAMAASSCCRSLAGAALPFAASPMYSKLGVAWASSLLGFLSLAMCIIPFGFLAYGDKIREGSRFCQYLQERKKAERLELERERGVVLRDGMKEDPDAVREREV